MEKIILDTHIPDGMYMDIHSIEFEIDREKLRELIEKCLKVIEENDFISSVTVYLYDTDHIRSIRYFDSTEDDEEKTEDVDTRIGTELLSISNHGVFYRGYSKWTSDFLEVDLTFC